MLKIKKISLEELKEFHKEKFLPAFLENLIIIEDENNLKVFLIPGQVFLTFEAKEIFENESLDTFLKTFSIAIFQFHRKCKTEVSIETPNYQISELFGDSETDFTNCRYCHLCNCYHYYSSTNLNWHD